MDCYICPKQRLCSGAVCYYDDHDEPDLEQDYKNGYEAGKAAGAPKWHSASEMLPTLCDRVLVFQPERKARQRVFEAFLSRGFHGDEKEHWLSSNAYSGGGSREYTTDEITHWTMLPDPPRDGEESPWIPFSEDAKEMLEQQGEVLIFVPVSPFSIEEHKAVVTTTFFMHGEWYGRYELEDITHWMPLPEPPKEV